MNHVSTLTEDFNVTVDRLQRMANLTVKGVPDVVPQGSTQTLTTSVLIDMSVPATVRYEHTGTGGRGGTFVLSSTSVSCPFFLSPRALLELCSSTASQPLPRSFNRLLTKNFPLCWAVCAVLSTFLHSFSHIPHFSSLSPFSVQRDILSQVSTSLNQIL